MHTVNGGPVFPILCLVAHSSNEDFDLPSLSVSRHCGKNQAYFFDNSCILHCALMKCLIKVVLS